MFIVPPRDSLLSSVFDPHHGTVTRFCTEPRCFQDVPLLPEPLRDQVLVLVHLDAEVFGVSGRCDPTTLIDLHV